MKPASLSKAVRLAGEQGAGGDELFAHGLAAPRQGEAGAAEALEVFDLDVVFLAGDEIDGSRGEIGWWMDCPAIEQTLTVDPEAHAVVGGDMEGVAPGF